VDRRPPPALMVPGSFRLAVVPLLLAAATLAFGLLQAFRLGSIESIDFLKAWGLKGTALFEEGNLDFSNLSGPHLFYPLEVSNLNGAFYVLLGKVDDEVVRLPAALFGISLALVLWWLARLMLPPAGAGLAVALAVMTPEFTGLMTNGLADLVLAAYVTVCVLAAYRWLEDGGPAWAPLSGFAAGAAAWTKLEGALTCLVILAGVMAVRRAVRTPGAGVWLAWFAAFVVPWQIFQRVHDIPANRSHFKEIYLNAAWIVDHVARTLAETSRWGLFWPLCLALIAASAPLWWPTQFRGLAALTLPNVVLTLGAYVTHYRAGEADSVEATAHRLYMHIAPTLAVMAAAGATVALGIVCAWRRDAQSPRPTRAPESS
jgi:4-amino-4-deoxy-L-arabinose transferase-like glycosyltransferase